MEDPFVLQKNVPMIFLPTHRSHMDYILITFILLNFDIKAPHVAAGDNLLIPLFRCVSFVALWLYKTLSCGVIVLVVQNFARIWFQGFPQSSFFNTFFIRNVASMVHNILCSGFPVVREYRGGGVSAWIMEKSSNQGKKSVWNYWPHVVFCQTFQNEVFVTFTLLGCMQWCDLKAKMFAISPNFGNFYISISKGLLHWNFFAAILEEHKKVFFLSKKGENCSWNVSFFVQKNQEIRKFWLPGLTSGGNLCVGTKKKPHIVQF